MEITQTDGGVNSPGTVGSVEPSVASADTASVLRRVVLRPAKPSIIAALQDRRTRPHLAAVLSGALLLLTTLLVSVLNVGQPIAGNLAQFLAACAACVSCWRTARQAQGRMRSSWSAIAGGCAGWAVGQVVYTICAVGRDATQESQPSVADIGFLLLPIGGIVCLLMFTRPGGKPAVLASLLDFCALLTALVAVSWPAVQSNLIDHQHAGTLALAKVFAYPALDIVVIALAFYSVSRPTAHRSTLVLLAVGITMLALADVLAASPTNSLADPGFVAALLFLAIAATAGRRLMQVDSALVAGDPVAAGPTPGAAMLPYLPQAVAILATAVRTILGAGTGTLVPLAIAVSVATVLLRQYLTVRDNRRLLERLHASEDELRLQAFHDRLTGLANRALFTDRVAHALTLHRRDLRRLGLLFCDLDDFKAVNDTLGHAAGDQILIRVAERLRGALRDGDTLARFGGDEFAVLLEDGSEPTVVGARIIDALRPPFVLGDTVVSVALSVGVTDLEGGQPSPGLDELLAHADVAMYSAKRAGKGQLALYNPSMVLPAAEDLRLREPLRTALRTGNVIAVYQPIVDLSDGRMTAVETLARWRHDGLQVSPVEFVPLAGRAGLLAELTDHMLDQACAQLATWTRDYPAHRLSIGVNIPPQLIVDRDFPDRAAAAVARHGVRPDQLVLEITEDALLGDLPTARAVTATLRRIGMSLSLDDFGTGYSSLRHLQQIPLDALKIDISFVANVDRDAAAERFIRAFLTLGQDLGLAVTAEGVEREEQAATLRRLGCPTAQGFLFGRPGPAAALDFSLLRPGARWAPIPGQRERRSTSERR